METKDLHNQSRRFFLDNLKVLLTVLVVFHHSAQAYCDCNWAYKPSNPQEYIDGLWHFLSTNAAFFMGLFFFISGYFVPRSYDKQGFGRFLGKKVLRLLVPMAAMTAFLSLATGIFETGHTWFLGSLFFFCLVYALLRLVLKPAPEGCLSRPTIVGMLIAAIVMGVGSYFIREVSPQDNWIRILWILNIEPAHYLQYILMFALGVLAGRFGWFEKMTRGTGLTALLIGVALCLGNYARTDGAWSYFVYRSSASTSRCSASFCASVWYGFSASFASGAAASGAGRPVRPTVST